MSMNGGEGSGQYDKPVPRDPKSPAKKAQIQAQNRRREYLQRHPAYFGSLDHELADPILYEKLVKRFQSAAERADEGKAKGYGRLLEASLIRGETNLANLATSTVDANNDDAPRSLGQQAAAAAAAAAAAGNGNGHTRIQTAESSAAGVDEPWTASVTDKEEGLEAWAGYLEDRFVRGMDDDFDYTLVDDDEDLDVLKRRDEEDKWFDDEEPSWVNDRGDGTGAEAESDKRGHATGETGIQDY